MIGPIQLLAVKFETLEGFQGGIAAEISDLIRRSMIRLIDLQFLAKTADGSLLVMQDSSLTAEEAEEFGGLLKRLLGLSKDEAAGVTAADTFALAEESFGIGLSDLIELKEQIEPGTAVALMLFEHTWATGFKHALRAAGGVPILTGFLTQEAVALVGSELRAMVEAERAIEMADAVKMAAYLDALRTVAEADLIQQAAIAETAEVIEAAQLVQSAIVADVLHTLIVAGLVEEAATARAIDALFTAGLIEQAAMAHADATLAALETGNDDAQNPGG